LAARKLRTSTRLRREREAIAKAAVEFNITSARRNKIVVTRIEDKPVGRI
jgi:hypothetical protein